VLGTRKAKAHKAIQTERKHRQVLNPEDILEPTPAMKRLVALMDWQDIKTDLDALVLADTPDETH